MSLGLGASPAYTAEEARRPDAVSARLAARGVSLEPDEVTLLVELLGRPPLWAECVLFGILWSEHCSYKSTRHLLAGLPTDAPQVAIGPGEDAGVVRLPAPCEDLALVLAHESHNHPSQVLPVEGAATGVGGIVRDVGCMGATVVGVLDCLRFGDPRSGVHARDVARGVVQGIADYGNALGVPNLGGDVVFDSGFDQSCLVNVMALGVAPADGVLRSRVPAGLGTWAFVLVGKPTDESGFGGAAFASAALGGDDQRGAVQLPDPFLKRVLHVANAEAFERVRRRGIAAGFKDLGAGGLACATSELAAAGGRGATIELDRVPSVARPIPPEVLLCAETQERFCWVVPESFAAELCEIYDTEYALASVHPGASACVVGRATEERRYRVTWRGETVVDCPVDAITAGRRIRRPARRRAPEAPFKPRRGAPDAHAALLTLLASPNLCSREYLYRHYDSEVQGRTWLRPGEGDAAVFAPAPGRALGVAVAVGGNPFWCAADPGLGARHAVAEAARNVACAGARPWALTDCLNFGDPADEGVMGDLEATIEGLSAAASALGGLAHRGAPLPFVSGNVSLYNQSGERAIPPSPIVMCAGVVRDLATVTGLALQSPGDLLVLVGEPRDSLTGSAYAREVLRQRSGAPPALDLEREARLEEIAVLAAESGWVRAAHDVSDGGLAVALAEMMLAAPSGSGVGLEVDLEPLAAEAGAALFCERPAVVFEVSPARAPALFQAARERALPAWPLGTVTGSRRLRAQAAGAGVLAWTLEELRAAAGATLERIWNEELE
ncbi:MAG TPA: phosphoribosylformylglycinamidine synthase subunit PurL [Candidatus Eisenbacteria bacterium]